MWYRIYFIGKFKIMLIVNEIIFLHHLTGWAKVIYVNRQNKTIKK